MVQREIVYEDCATSLERSWVPKRQWNWTIRLNRPFETEHGPVSRASNDGNVKSSRWVRSAIETKNGVRLS